MNIKKHIPNSLTCANLICGCLGIKFSFEGHLIWASYMIGLAAVFDFFDGFAARLLKVSSPIGKDLDSLADMVTFGVLPGIIIYQLLLLAVDINGLNSDSWLPYIAFMIPVFSALRLAKFNNDSRQTDSFIGVPTPAVTLFIGSFPLIMNNPLVKSDMTHWATSPLAALQQSVNFTPNLADTLFSNFYVLSAITVVMSFLLVAELPLFALKFKSFKWADNKIRFVFLICCVVLLIIFKFAAVPLIIILYIGLSVINNLMGKKSENIL